MASSSISPGFSSSRLVFGTWRLLDAIDVSAQSINRLLNTCLDHGIHTIDTAEIYGIYEVEEALGKALSLSPGLREKLQIVTKCGIYIPCKFHPDRKTAFYNATAERILKSAEKSLRFLGTDYLDLMLVHRPDWLTRADDTAKGLNDLLGQGKIKYAGVSNYNVHQFELLNSYMEQPLAANQIEFHLLHTEPIFDGVLNQCERLNVLPMAWSPLAGGKLFDASLPSTQRLIETVKSLSSKYGNASLEQLAYAWILAHPSRPAVVIGTNKVERVINAVAAEHIVLEREDWYALTEAGRGAPIP